MRCSICDATHDGQLSDKPFKRTRKFYVNKRKPWLLECSDCVVFGQNGLDGSADAILAGEIPNLETGWDTYDD